MDPFVSHLVSSRAATETQIIAKANEQINLAQEAIKTGHVLFAGEIYKQLLTLAQQVSSPLAHCQSQFRTTLDELNEYYIAISQPSVLESGNLHDIRLREMLIAEMMDRDMDISWAGPEHELGGVIASVPSVLPEGLYHHSNTTQILKNAHEFMAEAIEKFRNEGKRLADYQSMQVAVACNTMVCNSIAQLGNSFRL